MTGIVALIGLFFLSAVFGIGITFARFILAPILQATKKKPAVFRFYISDFFSMTLMLALPAFFISRAGDQALSRLSIVVLCVGSVIALWAWVRGASKLSSINVESPFKRFVFLAIILPIVILGIGFAVPWSVLLVFSLFMRNSTGNPLSFILVFLGLPLLALFSRQICKWVVHQPGGLEEPFEQLDEVSGSENGS